MSETNSVKTGILNAICSKCLHQWHPYGDSKRPLPSIAKLKCPRCGTIEEFEWLDSATQRDIIIMREKAKLQGSVASFDPRIDNLLSIIEEMKKRIDILEQGITVQKAQGEIASKKMALVEDRIQSLTAKTDEVKEWSEKREQEFQIIDKWAEEIEEDERFKEKHR